MVKKFFQPKVVAMLPSELNDFVRNKAEAGDIAYTFDSRTDKQYVYFCTPDNIGKDINPIWMMLDETQWLRSMFENMTLEEKVEFLVDKYIQENTQR